MLLYTNRTQSPAIVVLSLFSCNPSQGETDASTGSTSSGSATDGPTTGEPGMCSNSMPTVGGPCAPFGVIAAGVDHTCTLLLGGKVRCWGYNDYGQLGVGSVNTVGDDETPNALPPLDLGEAAIQVAPGRYHTCAVTESGRVYCWGSGKFGLLGSGSSTNIGDDEPAGSTGPVPLQGSAIQVAAGFMHTCALMSDGSVYCWGSGQYGTLGTGNTEIIGDDEAPDTQAPLDLGGRAVQLDAYREHTCAVLEDGGVTCWGLGESGQLGRGNTENIGDDETPGALGPIDVGAAVVQVATGAFHTCVLTVAGEIRCWGAHGAVGYGNTMDIGDDEPPSQAGAVSLGGQAVGIAAASGTTCALLSDGMTKCWGDNLDGQLGGVTQGNIGTQNVPSDFGPIDVGGTVAQVAVGNDHVCALLDDESIRCWGNATTGAAGYGNVGTWDMPGSTCNGFGSVCDLDPVCCIGDMPGEMPPPPVQYQ